MNGVVTMDRRWFGGCSKKLINQLMIQSSNPLAETKQEFFQGFERLYLEDVEDGKIPSFFRMMENLTSLTICNSSLGKVLRSSMFPENLRHLGVGGCDIEDFIFDGNGLSDLISLNLSGNSLKKIPAGIDTLPILYEVVLSGNDISGTVDLSIFNGREVLVDLSGNHISSLIGYKSASFKAMDNLKIDNDVSIAPAFGGVSEQLSH